MDQQTALVSVKRNIVISVNRCFDTLVDEDLVSTDRLHGYVMNRLYNQKIYTSDVSLWGF